MIHISKSLNDLKKAVTLSTHMEKSEKFCYIELKCEWIISKLSEISGYNISCLSCYPNETNFKRLSLLFEYNDQNEYSISLICVWIQRETMWYHTNCRTLIKRLNNFFLLKLTKIIKAVVLSILTLLGISSKKSHSWRLISPQNNCVSILNQWFNLKNDPKL